MREAWLHLHLPRLKAYRAGEGGDEVISLKIPGHRIRYVSRAVVRNARFHVSEPGRQRCIDDGQRNVHAWVVGELVSNFERVVEGISPRREGYVARTAVYDPWKGPTFVDLETKEPIYEANMVVMLRDRVWYY